MYDHYQIEIPESFYALFLIGGRIRPNVTREVIAARYDLCEDLASQLSGYALARHLDLGIDEKEVLVRCHLALAGGEAGVSPQEAVWIIRRLAELLDWRCPPLEDQAADIQSAHSIKKIAP